MSHDSSGRSLHRPLFTLSVVWTLALLFLGSVVHATESSLACPDWPTCFGTMTPEMTGGVFWEHLHRLVAGGLLILFLVAAIFAQRSATASPAVRRWAWIGVGLLLIQSVLGGLTVLWRLPDAISTSHLTLAFIFLALAAVLATVTSERWSGFVDGLSSDLLRSIRTGASALAFLVLGQSAWGALVRHTDSGLACPDIPTCLGAWVPPLQQSQVVIHFGHRVVAVILTVAVLVFAWRVMRRVSAGPIRTAALGSVLAVVAQVALGIFSVTTVLGVVPVSLHTLGAALLLCLLVRMAALASAPAGHSEPDRVHEARMAA